MIHLKNVAGLLDCFFMSCGITLTCVIVQDPTLQLATLHDYLYNLLQEMSGLCYFMMDQSRKDAEYCMENAFSTYLVFIS